MIYVARGEVAAEPDLVAVLESEMLAGAFLDVFALEPLAKGSPLWAVRNVMSRRTRLATPAATQRPSPKFSWKT